MINVSLLETNINKNNMKKTLLSMLVVVMAVFSSCGDDASKTQLFNGENLDGWVLYSNPDSELTPSEVFTVKDGVINVLGNPYGYMRTAKKYADFIAHCEYRWTDGKGTNSGFFLRMQDGDKLFPAMIECQLQAGHAGDLLGSGAIGAEVQPGTKGPKLIPRKDADGLEAAIGEWTPVDVKCEGSHVTISINGKVVNECETELTEGFLALQSEGGPIEFRNVWVKEIKPAVGEDKPELSYNEVTLFNGTDLTGWTLFTDPKETKVKAEDVFTVKDGVISVLGNPFGYMRTNTQFSNYRLHAEWRWTGGKATNSGIFQRVQEGDTLWPIGMECQLAAGQAGTIVGLGGYKVEGAEMRGEFAVKARIAAEPSEKETGEWNVAEVECIGKSIKIYVNGVLQNEGVGQFSRGYIALQSEGGPLEFRNVVVTEL